MTRPGLEPGTPRFSVVPCRPSNSAESPANWARSTRYLRGVDVRELRAFHLGLGDDGRLIARMIGGSAALHLLAVAHEAEVSLSLEDLTDVASRTPVIADLAPSGRWMAEDFQRAGGTRALIRELIGMYQRHNNFVLFRQLMK